ncbi:MAG TPA: PTS glucose transporter subunit IIA [Lentibacillus sp.]|uniref:PTS sugar transporter subunit IIA n=1 Tax=Lentibacillus sp. TaxID=1925746 RepID=UPI002B4AE85D|nr:PTS glucose transporter subunit IIA [Lentibacillus sp.]HLR62818.1 PTS glucose transporter subunit IIA [Lentibacillus sp.]
MLKKLFGKKEAEKEVAIFAPLTGKVIPLENVPDPVFSQKMMGDGVAIEPVIETVLAPVKGKIVQLFQTKHAIGLETENGMEILIHIGLETVRLNGEGFISHVHEGDKVNPGDKLITFEMNIIKSKAESVVTPVIITNTAEMQQINVTETKEVTAGQDHILLVRK